MKYVQNYRLTWKRNYQIYDKLEKTFFGSLIEIFETLEIMDFLKRNIAGMRGSSIFYKFLAAALSVLKLSIDTLQNSKKFSLHFLQKQTYKFDHPLQSDPVIYSLRSLLLSLFKKSAPRINPYPLSVSSLHLSHPFVTLSHWDSMIR